MRSLEGFLRRVLVSPSVQSARTAASGCWAAARACDSARVSRSAASACGSGSGASATTLTDSESSGGAGSGGPCSGCCCAWALSAAAAAVAAVRLSSPVSRSRASRAAGADQLPLNAERPLAGRLIGRDRPHLVVDVVIQLIEGDLAVLVPVGLPRL